MTPDVSRHPEAERLAEYAEGGLNAAARAEVEAHLALCQACRSVVMETMAFLDAEPAQAEAPAATVLPFRPRTWLTATAAILAVAAALTIAIRVDRPASLDGSRGDRPELHDLIAAVANEPTRPVEGRLSGGFKYGPPPSANRGSRATELSPATRIAAAELETAGSASGARQDAARGVAMLVEGIPGAAVAALDNAVREDPANASYQNDLAAAYIARGKASDRPGDFALAVAAAESSIKMRPDLGEAWFNRALALEAQGARAAAAQAWIEAAAHQDDPRWRAEAASRAESLAKPAS